MIETRLVKELVPYDNNAREIKEDAINAVAESIRIHGQIKPVVLSEAGHPFGQEVICCGHTTTLALKKLGISTAKVVVAKFEDEAEFLDYNIRDNKSAEFSLWDEGELVNIASQFDIDLGQMGFDMTELLDEQMTDGLTDEDEVPEVPEEPTAKLGQIWELGAHRLMCGDSTDKEQVERLMGGEKADLLHTDPPYGVDYEGVNNDHLKAEKLRGFIKDALTLAFESMREGANAYVWHPDVHAYEFIGAFRDSGFRQAKPSTIQWVKDSLVLSQGDYHSRNEPCLYGWKEGGKRQRVEDRKQDTIWEAPKPKKADGHPTMKPTQICERAIINSSKSGWTVLDLFGGGGSTLIACEKTGRKCRMMELDPKYCDVIIKRWEDFTGKEAKLVS